MFIDFLKQKPFPPTFAHTLDEADIEYLCVIAQGIDKKLNDLSLARKNEVIDMSSFSIEYPQIEWKNDEDCYVLLNKNNPYKPNNTNCFDKIYAPVPAFELALSCRLSDNLDKNIIALGREFVRLENEQYTCLLNAASTTIVEPVSHCFIRCDPTILPAQREKEYDGEVVAYIETGYAITGKRI